MATVYSPKIVTDGLVFCIDAADRKSYPGTGTTWSDRSGNGHNLTLTNGPIFTFANGGIIDFDGSNDYSKTTDVIIASPTSLTIGGWFKKNGNGGSFETALHHGTSTSVGGSSYWFGFDNVNIITGTIGANAGSGWAAGRTDITAVLGVWYHLISTWDGTTVRTYLDGILKKTYSRSTYSSLTTPTRVGSSGDGTGYLMNGSVANVFISKNKYFTHEEVLQNYNATKDRFIR
tara:strand:- start:58 stop:753 length:696 start_codon:yes stop_codon:yes gene_type:complete